MPEFAGRSDVGRMRDRNEDRFLALRHGGMTLLAIADGVAGESGGDVASAAAVDGLASSFDFGSPDAASALSAAMRAANDAVVKAAGERGHATAASTLVAAAVRGRRCAIANLGDSRAYLVRGGAAQRITTDHAGAVPSSITRFVGDPRGVAPDVFTESLRPRDRLVLCSDGLTRHVAEGEIARVASQAPARAARALVDLANARGGEDNVTVVVYESASPASRVLLFAALALAAAAVALASLTFAPAPGPAPSASPPPAESPSPTASATASPTATP